MPGGTVSDALVEFHRRVAAGGVAMTTVAYLAVSPEGRTDRHCLLLNEDNLAGLRRLTDAVHAEGAAAAAQIGHAGPVANARSNRAPALSPSGGFTPMGSRLRAVDAAGVERITDDYRRAARVAVEAGFDSIEVHVGHNYLLSAFLSPKLNRRDDQFGGSVENRARFARAVLRTVRDEVGTADRGHGQAQHGRRRRRRSVARGQRRGGFALRTGRRARRARAHRGQLAGQPHVPLPRRRADAGVRRHPPAAGPARLQSRREAFPAQLPLRGGVLPPLRPPVPGRAVHAAHPARRHHRTGDHRVGAGRRLRLRRHGPCPPARTGPAQPRCATAARRLRCASTATSACRPSIRAPAACWWPTARRPVRQRPAASGRPTAPPARAARPGRGASPRRRSARRTARRSAARRRSRPAAARSPAVP